MDGKKPYHHLVYRIFDCICMISFCYLFSLTRSNTSLDDPAGSTNWFALACIHFSLVWHSVVDVANFISVCSSCGCFSTHLHSCARFPTVKLEDRWLRGQGLNDQSPSAHSGKSRRKLRFYIFHEGSLARRLCDRLVTVWIESGVISGLQAATCGACGAQSHPRSEI